MARGAVISGATRGRGGAALGRHLADRRAERQNDETRLGSTRGVFACDVQAAIDELTRIVCHVRSRQPIYHVHLDPEVPWTKAQRARYWSALETEFGFERQPFVEAIHVKHGREHYHRAYSRVRSDGTVIPLSHDYARREKVGRQIEFEFGGRHVAGRHNRAAAHVLAREGHHEVVRSMEASGILTQARPEARMTPKERHQAARTSIDPTDVQAVAFRIWTTSETEMLIPDLAAEGLRLCQGDKGPVLLDLAGGVHSLTRSIGRTSNARGNRIGAAEVKARLSGLGLPHLSEQRGYHHDRPTTTEDVPDLEQEDHAGPVEAGNSPGPIGNSRAPRKIYRQARPHADRRRDAARLRKLGAAEAAAGSPADPTARREDKPRENTPLVGELGTVECRNPERTGRPLRTARRARATEHRIEQLLDEPKTRLRLDQIEMLVDSPDSTRSQTLWLEGRRVGIMLSDNEFEHGLRLIDKLAVALLALVKWIIENLIGHRAMPIRKQMEAQPTDPALEVGDIPDMSP